VLTEDLLEPFELIQFSFLQWIRAIPSAALIGIADIKRSALLTI